MSDHGTNSRYTQGCRCPDCTNARRLYMRNYRASRNTLAAYRERNSRDLQHQ